MKQPPNPEPSSSAAGNRYVFIQRPACPLCGSFALKTCRSSQNGDGTVSRNTHCKTCGHKFIVVVE